jgi:hypothetical protein
VFRKINGNFAFAYVSGYPNVPCFYAKGFEQNCRNYSSEFYEIPGSVAQTAEKQKETKKSP